MSMVGAFRRRVYIAETSITHLQRAAISHALRPRIKPVRVIKNVRLPLNIVPAWQTTRNIGSASASRTPAIVTCAMLVTVKVISGKQSRSQNEVHHQSTSCHINFLPYMKLWYRRKSQLMPSGSLNTS